MKIKTKTKRKIYIFCAIILGVLLGTLLYSLAEKRAIEDMLVAGNVRAVYGNFFLPPAVSFISISGGAIFGYILGVRWWQIVYVEKRHWRCKK
jgi:hypothetical protein